MSLHADRVRIKHIWNQTVTPVIVARKGEDLKVRMPFAEDNRRWLRGSRSNRKPMFVREHVPYWLLPRSRFNELVNMCLERYGKVHVVQPYHEKEVCAPACWNAVGWECQCSCCGANHGSGDGSGYHEINDTFAVRWGTEHLGHKLITRRHTHR